MRCYLCCFLMLSDVVEDVPGFGCTSPACNSNYMYIDRERHAIVTKP